MAPRNKSGKQRGEKKKKKKKEENFHPVVTEITVNLPYDSQVTLKGISTDKIIDVRRLLGMNCFTCAITGYSLSHEIRGPRLNDNVDVAVLKPCILTLVQEDYDEDGAKAHVRRLLDVVACTAVHGPAAADVAGDRRTRRPKTAGSNVDGGGGVRDDVSSPSPSPAAVDWTLDEEGETSGSRPQLRRFYEFFSLAHLTTPVQFARKIDGKNGDGNLRENHFFSFEVKLCNGKLVVVEACREGFYAVGKRRLFDHNLVVLLRQCSRAFESAYEELMHAFCERNKYGNLPYGYRANTWLVPPAVADHPSAFSSLPAEEEAWGGHGGGLGRGGTYDLIPWAKEFSFLASMPCETEEERLIRDRRAFLVHSIYVDVAVVKAISAVRHVIEGSNLNSSGERDGTLHFERAGDLIVTVFRDATNANCRVSTKVDGTRSLGMGSKNVLERNLLKGITADENSVVHDFATLGIVNVRYCGYIALVNVEAFIEDDVKLASENSMMNIHADGGANSLNINSLRMLLHEKNPLGWTKTVPTESKSEEEELKAALDFAKKVLKESLTQLVNKDQIEEESLRWELGACWIQYLRDQLVIKKDKKKMIVGSSNKTELAVEGLGKPLKVLKSTCKNSTSTNQDTELVETGVQAKSGSMCSVQELEVKNELYIKNLLSDSVFTRLKESETGLHCKSILELTDMAKKYYNEVALPKLVTDFESLDLSPVDGRTLTDFMHTRGVRMRSLGNIAELSVKLPHIHSLCVQEMVVRAFKHLLRAIISASGDIRKMAIVLASALNLMLGVSETERSDFAFCMDALVRQWLEAFLLKRFDWKLRGSHCLGIRKFAILRGLCHKVGLEVAPRDFDFNASNPFCISDIVSLVPVHKQVFCSSTDGRRLLESSKTALDKGKLEEAVEFGSKALAKLVVVCGPYHRTTAGAYSLFAVVLYHTGDFDQATIYQQKALDINEKELGLDHPDTMKSYGDLAVFYYRLQHTHLALKYVKRALYLLHLTCGSSHPNTAATYINMAMMEEDMGNVNIALRYLQKALNCNKELLGPDHVQTAASYHAIGVAFSLMEAYTLSVQHECTALQILRTKLGPDDLRTQDAAAWLEYFESKVVEQKEIARNGTRKSDTTIACKGYQSLSELLAFINPNRSYKESPDFASNKRKSGVKVKANVNGVNGLLTGDLFLNDSSSMSYTEKKHVDENLKEGNLEKEMVAKASEVPSDYVNDCKFIANDDSEGKVNSDGEEGWQSVSRFKSGRQVEQRVGQRKDIMKKLNHNSKMTKTSCLPCSGCRYGSKNTSSSQRYEDGHPMRSSHSSAKFGHASLESVAYKVKFQPLLEMIGNASSKHEINPSSKPLEHTDAINTTAETNISIVSVGRTQSYRDVAMNSQGPLDMTRKTISTEQYVESRLKTSGDQAEGFEYNVLQLNDSIYSLDSQVHSEENISVVLNDKVVTNEIGKVLLNGRTPSFGCCLNEGYKNEDSRVDRNVSMPCRVDDNTICCRGELGLLSNQFEKDFNVGTSSAGISNKIEDKFVTEETVDVNLKVDQHGSVGIEDFSSRRLSASAVPFNPSAAIPRGSLNSVGSPPIDRWYSNMLFYPGFASDTFTSASTWTPTYQSYFSSPISPSVLHPVQLIHPPESETQIQSINFSLSNTMFHPDSLTCNVADSIHGAAWSPYCPMDHLVMPTEDKSTNRVAVDSDTDRSEVIISSFGNRRCEENIEREETLIAEIISSDDEQDLWKNTGNELNFLVADKEIQSLLFTKECVENTTVSSIRNSTKGRKRGKQTLKVPMSSLSRTCDQPFKHVYNRIIRGSEFPKSTVHIPSAD